ncbi:plant UBX domain-containing protein 8-like [Tasmannia lanceolata]|uniref:plant UBX domain-containing protein 8-like n=1 Tax=Tasmannia lanceolata TaxID=3420 RepID=UPI004063A17B
MARPQQDAIETFMSITGASEAIALQKLEEHNGDLNEAVNAHFSEGDRTITHPRSVPQNDYMSIDDPLESLEPPLPLLSAARSLNPSAPLDPNFGRSFFDGRASADFTSRAPTVSHPREVKEIPIEVKDGNGQSSHSEPGPMIENVSGSAYPHGPENHGNVIIDDDEDEDLPIAPAIQNERKDDSYERRPGPSVPQLDNAADYGNDIEEEMLQAAIEASKREVEEGYPDLRFGVPNDSSGPQPEQRYPPSDDVELARAVSLSLKTAEQEKALREQSGPSGTAERVVHDSSGMDELGGKAAANGRQGLGSSSKESSSQFKSEVGNSSLQEEAEDVEEQPLVRHRSRRSPSGASESAKEIAEMVDSPPSSPEPHDIGSHPQHNGDAFHSDEWGGLSSVEHDEAVMLEAALFGGIPEGAAYRFPYPPQVLQTGSDMDADIYPRRVPRPPSPTLAAQRLLREQQDDEYNAALQADREKELKAIEEAEIRRLEAAAAREAALEKEKHQQEETRRKLLEEEEFERMLAAKQASLPQEPTSDDESAVTLLVRMPDGSRRGRRFLKSNKLQSLFDFIDVGRGVKPGTYRLVRPYPRRAFSDGESGLSLSELGLTSKQEALFLELI